MRAANAREEAESSAKLLEARERILQMELLRAEEKHRNAEEERRKLLMERESELWKREDEARASRKEENKKNSSHNISPDQDIAITQNLLVKAQQGDTASQIILGTRYATGKGCEEDPVAAYMWYTVSMDKEPLAVRLLSEVVKEMTPEQIKQAQQRSRDWKPTIPSEILHKETHANSTSNRFAEYRKGYENGYKKADPLGIPSIAPTPDAGHVSYEDGFGRGYAQALEDKNLRLNGQR